MIILLKGLCAIVCLQPQSTRLSDSGGAFQSFAAALLIERKAASSLVLHIYHTRPLEILQKFSVGAQGSWDMKPLSEFGACIYLSQFPIFFRKWRKNWDHKRLSCNIIFHKYTSFHLLDIVLLKHIQSDQQSSLQCSRKETKCQRSTLTRATLPTPNLEPGSKNTS